MTTPPVHVGLRRRELLMAGAAGAGALLWPGGAQAARKAKAPALPPRLAPARRRTLGAVMDLDVGGLTRTERTRAVSRVEYVYRRSSTDVRIRVERTLATVEGGAAGGFSTLSLADRRAFALAQEPPAGVVADFAAVQGFRRFVDLQGQAVATEAAVAGLPDQAEDPTLADAPDQAPPGDASARYAAQRASSAELVRSALREARALGLTAFQDDLEEG